MRISVIGTGYVGLVTGACLAESGNAVLNADIDEAKIAKLRAGGIPIFEPGLEELVDRNAREGRLSFTTSVEEAVRFGDVLFIAVGTPPGKDGAADLSYVFDAARTIAEGADRPKVVATKSTVPIGTGQRIQAIFDGRSGPRIVTASNPEFLREGSAIQDFTDPDRIVIGTEFDEAREQMHRIYEPIAASAPSRRAAIVDMDLASAEMTKYAANAMLAARISFMNELARLCWELGANVDQVRRGIGLDPRIGKRFLNPGIGYGGSCFPKDVQALIATGRDHDVPFRILEAVHDVNEDQKRVLAEKVRGFFGDELGGRTLAIWGLAFKPNTDDMREAPSIVIIEDLLDAGARIQAYDPIAHETAAEIFGDRIAYADSNYGALEGADALLLLTEWPEFSQPDLGRMKAHLRHPIVFDGRNVYRPERLREKGFTYFSIGRAPVILHDPSKL